LAKYVKEKVMDIEGLLKKITPNKQTQKGTREKPPKKSKKNSGKIRCFYNPNIFLYFFRDNLIKKDENVGRYFFKPLVILTQKPRLLNEITTTFPGA